MSKRLISVLLVILIVLSFAACGNKDDVENGYIFKGYVTSEKVADLGDVSNPIDIESVYKKVKYTPEMFYGRYVLKGGKEAHEKYAEEAKYFDYVDSSNTKQLTLFPYFIESGNDTWKHTINNIDGYNWMNLGYYEKSAKDGKPVLSGLSCAYSVEGNKLTLKPLKEFHVDTETKKITYEFAESVIEYEFSFSGRNLTISKDGNNITLTTGAGYNGDGFLLYAEGYLSEGSKALDGIENIDLRYESEKDNRILFKKNDGTGSWTSILKLEENGLATFTIPWESGTKTYQYVYFLCGDEGIIFTDGENTYYYNDSWSERNKNTINKYVSEDQTGKVDELSEQELEALVEKKENLMEDLAKAFNDTGIKVTVDQTSGEIAMDSSVLFGGDSAVLTADGKEFLNKFVNAYTSIVFSEKYNGFVSKTMIEGHTAPVAGSTYESGLPLSEQRANNVKDYCISSETGVDTSKLSGSLEAVGYSNSKPVKDATGNVDMAASRRVSFRFLINLSK